MMFCFDGNSFTPLMIKKKMHLHLNLGWATLWYVTSPCAIWYKSCLALQGLLESHCGLCRIVLDSLCTVKLTPSNICNGWELIRIDGNWSDLINIDAILDPVYQSNSLSVLLSLLSSAKGSLHRFLVSTHVCDRCSLSYYGLFERGKPCRTVLSISVLLSERPVAHNLKNIPQPILR